MDTVTVLVFIVWSLGLVFYSARLWLIAKELEQEREQLRRWLRRHDEKNNRQRV